MKELPKTIEELMIRTFGRNPKEPEYELMETHINKWGMEKVFKTYKSAVLKGFKNLGTLDESLDKDGNIKPKEQPDWKQKLDNSTYKPVNNQKKVCENDCGREGTHIMNDKNGRSWRVCSRKCFDELIIKNKNAFETILRGFDFK